MTLPQKFKPVYDNLFNIYRNFYICVADEQDRDLASAFGLLVHGLKVSGLNRVEDLFNKWAKHWESIALNQVHFPYHTGTK